jgi:hypothetical protein
MLDFNALNREARKTKDGPRVSAHLDADGTYFIVMLMRRGQAVAQLHRTRDLAAARTFVTALA